MLRKGKERPAEMVSDWRLMKVLAVVNSLASRARQVNNASRESYRTLLVSTCRRTRTRDYGTGTHSSSSSSAVWARQCQWVMPHAHSHLGTALSSTERADVCISLFTKGRLGRREGNERTNDGINILRSLCCAVLVYATLSIYGIVAHSP